MKKLVVKLDLEDDRAKQKALKTVSTLQGIDSISVDMKERKLTVIGTVDPVNVVSKLRKYWQTDIVTVGPAKEPEKKEEAKSKPADEPKKDGGQDPAAAGAKTAEQQQQESSKKEGEGGEEGKNEGEAQVKKQGGGGQGKKGEGEKTREGIVYNNDPVLELARAYRAYNPHMTSYYYAQSMEENPNACVIS